MSIGARLWGQPMYEIVIARDEESGQFYVHDSDIIGLNACADTMEALFEIISDVAPELIAHNHKRPHGFLDHVAAVFRSSSPREYRVRVSQDLCIAAS